jgi:AcrR family transcriptional regulator
MASRSPAETAVSGGLRERKKARTKLAIQEHAVRLFREQGYAQTTIEQIAEAAEVSPSTVFRYFPTKEDLVTTDEIDPLVYAAFEAQPPELTLAQAWRAAIASTYAQLTEAEVETEKDRGLLFLTVPELWGASLSSITKSTDTLIAMSARRTGRDVTDPELRTAIGAIFGVLLLAAFDWVRNPEGNILAVIDDAFGQLEKGIIL